jgi:hypothetical protein
MWDDRTIHWTGRIALRVALLCGTVVATLAALHPAAAQSMLAQAAQNVTCATTVACIAGSNSASGAGVAGTSVKGPGLHATSTNGIGLTANSSTNFGISGTSTGGQAGVEGSTAAHFGVYGFTTAASGGTGVVGYAPSGVGVYGSTAGSGYGVDAFATSGVGVFGQASSGTALMAASQSGYGANLSSSTGTALYAHTGTSGLAVLAVSAGGNGGDFRGTYIGVIGRAPVTNGFPLVATDSSGNNLFYVDGAGDVVYHGGLFHFVRTKGAAEETAFSSDTTAPTMEDTGSAELVGGAASVRLDPAFAAALDLNAPYRVFVTPRGDTRGLYVAATTPGGFTVRESQGGHATVSFDYRVVATPLGQTGRRIALTADVAGPHARVPALPPAQIQPQSPKIPAAP